MQSNIKDTLLGPGMLTPQYPPTFCQDSAYKCPNSQPHPPSTGASPQSPEAINLQKHPECLTGLFLTSLPLPRQQLLRKSRRFLNL